MKKKGTMGAIGYFLVEHKSVIRFVLASYFIVMGTIGVRSLLYGTKEKYKEFTCDPGRNYPPTGILGENFRHCSFGFEHHV